MAEHERYGEVEGSGNEASRGLRKRGGPRRGNSRTVRKTDAKGRPRFTGAERVLLLDSWQRSGLPAQDFADLVGLAPHTLYEWRRRFRELGPAGLTGARRQGSGSRVAHAVRQCHRRARRVQVGAGLCTETVTTASQRIPRSS